MNGTLDLIRAHAVPLDGSRGVGPLLDLIGGGRLAGRVSRPSMDSRPGKRYQRRRRARRLRALSPLDVPQVYGHATTRGIEPSCEREVVAQLAK